MAYTDEVWLRARRQFNTNQQIYAWLNSFERPAKGANTYTRDALKVRDEFESALSIKEEIDRLSSLDDLDKVESIKDSINKVKIVEFEPDLNIYLDSQSKRIIERTVERDLLGEASKQIIGKKITKSEYSSYFKKGATSQERSYGVRIANRMRQLR